jgi:hypothetical protein
VETLEKRDVPAVTVNPLPANLVPDMSNPGFHILFAKGVSGWLQSAASNDRLFRSDQLFSLGLNDANLVSMASDDGATSGANYKDNGSVVVNGTPRDVGTPPLTVIKGTFIQGSEDDDWGMQAYGYLVVSAAQATSSQANPWTFQEASDDAARMIIGTNTILDPRGGAVNIGDAPRATTTDTNTVTFSAAGIYPIYLAYDQGNGGSDFAFWYNVPVAAGGDGANHVLGDTVTAPAPTGINLLPVVQNVITTVTAEPSGSVGSGAGMNVTFTKSSGAINSIASDILTAAGPGGLPQTIAYDSLTLSILTDFFANPLGSRGGAYVG